MGAGCRGWQELTTLTAGAASADSLGNRLDDLAPRERQNLRRMEDALPVPRLGRVIAVLLVLGAPLWAQTTPRAAFEVASVRLVERPTPSRQMITDSRVDLVSFPIREIILMAYGVERYRLVVPDWVLQAGIWVEIHATFPAGATSNQLPEMLRSLLTERFGMVAHTESRAIDAYELTVARGGMKLREVEAFDDRKTPYPTLKGGPDSPYDTMGGPEGQTRGIMSPTGGFRVITADTNYERMPTRYGTTKYDATRVRMVQLIDMLSSSLGKPVVDRTGLIGLYQFQIELPDNPALATQAQQLAGVATTSTPQVSDPAAGSAFKAVEGLGLTLEARRVLFEVVVVDRLEKNPTSN